MVLKINDKLSNNNEKSQKFNTFLKTFPVPLVMDNSKDNIYITKNIKTSSFIFDCEISIHIDNNNNFNQIFIPFVRELSSRINQLGLKCKIFWGDRETNTNKIILGAHSCPKYWLENANHNNIMVNFEPIHKDSWREKNSDYLELLRRHTVFDYCEINLPYLEESYSFKTPPLYSYLKPKMNKEYDFLFIGSINEYRKNTLRELVKNGIDPQIRFNILGNDVYNSIDEAKIYLNIDLDKESTFNEYRFMSCANTNTLFAGHSGDIKYHAEAEKLVGLSVFKDDEEMIKGLKNLISDSDYISKAFTAQYEYAKENRKKFDLFVRHHFLN